MVGLTTFWILAKPTLICLLQICCIRSKQTKLLTCVPNSLTFPISWDRPHFSIYSGGDKVPRSSRKFSNLFRVLHQLGRILFQVWLDVWWVLLMFPEALPKGDVSFGSYDQQNLSFTFHFLSKEGKAEYQLMGFRSNLSTRSRCCDSIMLLASPTCKQLTVLRTETDLQF
jgi:hypothetical protein